MTVASLKTIPDNARRMATMSDRQYLNAADRLMLVAHQGLLAVGHSGFTCQTHVWFDGRVDVARLRAALARLNEIHPVITSRLVAPGGYHVPYWSFRRDAAVELNEVNLDGCEDRDVWQFGESLCERPFSHAETAPIVWHLLHLPNGHDVLVIQFSHALMDGKAPEHMLKALDGLWDDVGGASTAPSPARKEDPPSPDEIVAHLRREPRRKRIRTAIRRLGHEFR